MCSAFCRLALIGVVVSATLPALGQRHFTIEQIVEIKHPSDPVWSPNGKYVVFTWDNQGVNNLWLVASDGHGAPRAVTHDEATASGGAFWSNDASTIYFRRGGQLWAEAVSGGPARPAWTDARGSDFTLAPDGRHLAYVRSQGGRGAAASLVVRDLAAGTQATVARRNSGGISAVDWSADGRWLTFTSGNEIIPHNRSFPNIGAKLIFAISEFKPGETYVVAASGGEPRVVNTGGSGGRGFFFGGGSAARLWTDDAHFLISHTLPLAKGRIISVADINGGAPRVIRRDLDPRFWSYAGGGGGEPSVSPDGKWIMFGADTDGWDHIWVMPADGGTAALVTPGLGDCWRAAWAHHSDRIAFDANTAGHPGDRQLGVVTITSDPAHARLTMLTSGRGTNYAAAWSPDDGEIAYSHTDPQHSSDLFVIPSRGGSPARLTQSMPESLRGDHFVAPQFLHYPGADGQPVPAYLFLPPGFSRAKMYPAIIWIHPDGVNMNYDGWHVNRQEATYYGIHQYLLQEGYVVLAVDYRGSIGYGVNWREAVYHDVGGQDSKDTQWGVKYLQSLGYVDPARIGVWGLSYGGFHTLVDVTQQPDWFRCAIDVAGVPDFRYYYMDPYQSGWIAERLGTPAENPQLYAQAAPIDHVSNIDHPLLVLAGTADVNVPFWQTVQLLDRLLKAGKGPLLTSQIYPGEFHYFDRGFVLRDAWHRVDDFFAANLHPEYPPPPYAAWK